MEIAGNSLLLYLRENVGCQRFTLEDIQEHIGSAFDGPDKSKSSMSDRIPETWSDNRLKEVLKYLVKCELIDSIGHDEFEISADGYFLYETLTGDYAESNEDNY